MPVTMILLALAATPAADPLPEIPVAGQPLAENARRLLEALEFLGAPLPAAEVPSLREAIAARDAGLIQRLLDPRVLLLVEINPEMRVKARRGPARAALQQGGYTPHLVKVVNLSASSERLRVTSPQAGQVFGGVSSLSAQRLQRQEKRETEDRKGDPTRFLDLEIFGLPPMTERLSGLEAEYAILLLHSRDAGRLEATIGFDVRQGAQDLGFRGEAPVLLEVRPAVEVKLAIADHDGRPTAARLVFRDAAGHVHPPQAKRLAPDLYFQEQVYRQDGDTVLLPPGRLRLEAGRGPEYRTLEREVEVPSSGPARIEVRLERWIDPAAHGFLSGDHHIHGAGCAHYESPTEGVTPADMFLQVKGEGLNVGCVLTWGPCFDFQRKFFSPGVDRISEPLAVLKYDLEVSGFGSEALGHVCLLDLRDQTFPGSEGTKTKGWPSWTTPVLRWAKAQGAVTGFAHSASGLAIDPAAASQRLLDALDAERNSLLEPDEAAHGLLPDAFTAIDLDGDGAATHAELVSAHQRAAERLPNLAVPEMDGVGAMEACVAVAEGVCDFVSSMDTPRIAEWNLWYHILDCGFPLKVSGETDFPCMSGDRVGQGRVYVRLGKVERIDFTAWCRGLAEGRSYVSDGFAHALEMRVGGVEPGPRPLELTAPGTVTVEARVAFAPETPLTVAQGGITPPAGKRLLGDTVELHGPRTRKVERGGMRRVEIMVNGRAVAHRDVPADGKVHDLRFVIPIEGSSWVALRHFPQLHTNPVTVIVAGKPVRASRTSALWCAETIRRLWQVRGGRIAPAEREEARRTFDRAIERYLAIAKECPEGS